MAPVAAAVLPHPPLLVPELAGTAAPELAPLRAACHEALSTVVAAADLTILIGDGPVWAVPAPSAPGSFRPYGADVDVALPTLVDLDLPALPPPAQLTDLPLSLAVAAHLLEALDPPPARLFAATVPRSLGPLAAATIGQTLATTARFGLVVMADLSASPNRTSPRRVPPRRRRLRRPGRGRLPDRNPATPPRPRPNPVRRPPRHRPRPPPGPRRRLRRDRVRGAGAGPGRGRALRRRLPGRPPDHMTIPPQPPGPPGLHPEVPDPSSDPRPGPVLALVGPTAAGKTELALAVAERLGAEVVSADAMLVYRGMDIGTAKPTPEERGRVPHHLVDLVDPGEEFSVARFQPLARAAIAEVLGRGRVPLLVGGSGLYFQAVVDEFVFPPTDPALRARLETEAAEVGLPELYRRLAEADPPAAAKIQPGNLRRTVRALEVMELTGRPFSSFRVAMDAPVSRYRLTVLGLDPGTELLRARVAERVEAMAEAGLVEEVRRLAGQPLSRTARQALGYKELLDAMEQGTPVSEALEAVVRRTRAYARRQLAWFRRDPRVRWSTLPPGPERVALALELFGKG